MQKKRLVAAVAAGMMAFSSFAASAEWLFAGYDTSDINNIVRVYNEVIGGEYTSKYKTEPVAYEDIEWIADGFERAFPHAGYDVLYVEGNRQDFVTRYNNTFAQWESRFVDCYWEIAGDCTDLDPTDHAIYQRQQTNIPGIGWEWDYSADAAFDASHLCVPTNRYADVAHEKALYGVAGYDLNGAFITKEVEQMYNDFGVSYGMDLAWLQSGALSEINTATGQYRYSDAEIAQHIDIIESEFLTGPGYPTGVVVQDAAAQYLAHSDWDGWCPETVRTVHDPKYISWTEPNYEMADPYRYYQYLVVGGIVFDGHKVNGVELPVIYRYTGGKATPVVEWRYAFSEANDPAAVMQLSNDFPVGAVIPVDQLPFKVVEYKFIDGKLAYDWATKAPIYRYNQEYANVYVKITPTEVQFWLKDAVQDVLLCAYNRGGKYGFYDGYVLSGVVVPATSPRHAQ